LAAVSAGCGENCRSYLKNGGRSTICGGGKWTKEVPGPRGKIRTQNSWRGRWACRIENKVVKKAGGGKGGVEWMFPFLTGVGKNRSMWGRKRTMEQKTEARAKGVSREKKQKK